MKRSWGSPLIPYLLSACLVVAGGLLVLWAASPPAQAAGPTLTQSTYRWYQNRNNITPNTALAVENAAISAVDAGTVLRLRVNVLVGGTALTVTTESFKLQFATSTSGPWTDVGSIGSSAIWRGYDNSTPADGATISTLLLSDSNVRGTYEEESPSALNPFQVNVGQRVEYDWVVQENGTAGLTTYYFRMVKADGTPLDGYTNYPQLTTAPAVSYSQNAYRWYANRDNLQPNTALAALNTPLANVVSGGGVVFRLRMSVTVSGRTLLAGSQAFKLQYATSTSGPWSDVGAIGSNTIWRGYDNPTPADGAQISATLLTGSDTRQSYEEQNPSALNPAQTGSSQDAEWDWVVQENGATPGETYYFRMVLADGTPLHAYPRYPQLTMYAPVRLTQDTYRWYQNRNNLTPNTPLAAENTRLDAALLNTVYRLRLNVLVSDYALPQDSVQFQLQYATSPSGPWTDVGAIGSGAIWRGYDNSTPADGATVGTSLLLSNSNRRGRYEEENPSASNPFQVNVGQRVEYDWVIQNNGAAGGTRYYFRLVRGDGSPLDGYTNYPELHTPGVNVTPNNTSHQDPEATAAYTHTITNTGLTTDTFDITASSSQGWSVALYQADGTTPLTDTDADTVLDTGPLAPSGSTNIVVKVTVPPDALANVQETTTVTARSSVDTARSQAVTNITTVNAFVRVTITGSPVNFGSISPDGAPSSEPGVSATTDAAGACYTLNETSGQWAVQVQVRSNAPWTGYAYAQENSGTSGIRVANGRFSWRIDGTSGWTPFTTSTQSSPYNNNVFPTQPIGTTTYRYDYQLCTNWVDDPGTFSAVVVYSVSP